ncbi:MAG: PVC-type heme-binding CxxCH protein [Pirellulales bacterium]
MGRRSTWRAGARASGRMNGWMSGRAIGWALLLGGWMSLAGSLAAQTVPRTADPLPDGSQAAERQIAALRVPAGLRVELYAAEPQLGNPVALCLDEQNRVFVAEEYRFNRGTEENRTRPFLLEDDLQVRTLDDRLAMFRKHLDRFEGGWDWFTRYTDQVRLLEDRDRDGRADRSTVYAADFNEPLAGLAAGVIARDGEVWFTCVPHLWRLRDVDGDGRADVREKLLTGFGVNAAFLGHDLHGLVWGPDGRLYFSVGDRGFHVTTREGTVLATPRRGAVFRCWPDGRELEVVHIGLRNPQELAFDDRGNLFAADNNCDRGDHSRLVYVVDGGDSGWNMAFQTMPDPYPTGPWHAERMWLVDGDAAAVGYQPAWVLPPVGQLGAGPSGFVHYPGTGLPPRYRDHFFLCNYTGNGGLEAFGLEPRGAGFAIIDAHDFLKPLFATDVDFGYDGQMYVSDFVGLEWNGGSVGGRIYRVFDPQLRQAATTRQVAELFAAGFDHRENDELATLLRHEDQRVRLRAQFALAARGQRSIGVWQSVVAERAHPLARLHALWGFGQVVRSHPAWSQEMPLEQLLQDEDAEVRGQTARVIGDCRLTALEAALIERLSDPAPRVQFLAAEAVGRLKSPSSAAALWRLIQANGNQDRYLRHAAVVALARLGPASEAAAKVADPDPAVRLAATLVLRRQDPTALRPFLHDSEVAVVTEAARALHDLAGDPASLAALEELAERFLVTPEGWPEALTRRVVNACFRRGQPAGWRMLARLAASDRVPLTLRRDALEALGQAAEPPQRDRVTGDWRERPAVDLAGLQAAVRPVMAELLATVPGELRPAVSTVVTRLRLPLEDATFLGWVRDPQEADGTRVAALELLGIRRHPEFAALLEQTLVDRSPALRSAARELIAQQDAARGEALYAAVLGDQRSERRERQRALAGLAKLQSPSADQLLTDWARRLADDQVPAELQLDIMQAVDARGLAAGKEQVRRFQATHARGTPLDRFLPALEGGDASRGRELFVGHRVAQCVRCHRVAGQGGDAGPDLSQVARRHDRAGLLESLVDPHAKIAANYGTVSLVLHDGRIVAGTLSKESADSVTLVTPERREVVVAVGDIDERSPPRSLMPPMDRALSLSELRDLVEYLAALR